MFHCSLTINFCYGTSSAKTFTKHGQSKITHIFWLVLSFLVYSWRNHAICFILKLQVPYSNMWYFSIFLPIIISSANSPYFTTEASDLYTLFSTQCTKTFIPSPLNDIWHTMKITSFFESQQISKYKKICSLPSKIVSIYFILSNCKLSPTFLPFTTFSVDLSYKY